MTTEKTTEHMDPAEQAAIEEATDDILFTVETEEIMDMLGDLTLEQLEEVRDYIGGMLS